MKSATHFSFGRVAVKSRRTRSGARTAAGSGWVVKRFFARLAPRMPVGAHQPGDLVPADVETGLAAPPG